VAGKEVDKEVDKEDGEFFPVPLFLGAGVREEKTALMAQM
jgi:hypothetical protein